MTIPTLYEVLGVARNAKNTDIGRAYNRLVREYQKETAPPDAKRDARLREAFETLTDADRRDAYDATLVVKRAKSGGKLAVVAAVLAVAIGGGGFYFAERAAAPKEVPGRASHEILADASRSVGRLQSIDVSGRATPVGLAFAIEEGVMAGTCAGVTPGAQLTVIMSARNASARLTTADAELGLCKIAVDGAGSWPLAISGAEPRAGDKVYAPKVSATGEVALSEGTVKRVVAEPKGRVIEVTMATSPEQGGGPLLDRYGRVVGVASVDGRHMAFPAGWAAPDRTRAKPQPAAPEPAPAAAQEATTPAAPRGPVLDLNAKRKEELQKALRPPPNVPDDL
jgi:hypothetical protein